MCSGKGNITTQWQLSAIRLQLKMCGSFACITNRMPIMSRTLILTFFSNRHISGRPNIYLGFCFLGGCRAALPQHFPTLTSLCFHLLCGRTLIETSKLPMPWPVTTYFPKYMEIEYFFREKLTKMFYETLEEKFMLEIMTKNSLCDHAESSKFR